MYHRFMVYLLACFGITQGYANESNITQKKDINAVVLFQGKEAYENHLKQTIEEKSPSKEGTKKEMVHFNENNMSDAFKMQTIKK